MVQALRRKMFKLGGEVSKSHGVGITSGLSYNKGGRVGFEPGGSVPGVIMEKLKRKPKTAPFAYLAEQLARLGPLASKFNPFRADGPIRSPVKYMMGNPSAAPRGLQYLDASVGRGLRGLESLAYYGTGFGAAPLYSTFVGRMTPEERENATDLQKAADTYLGLSEAATDFIAPIITTGAIATDTLLEAAKDEPSYLDALTLPDIYRKYIGDGLPEEPAPGPLVSGTAGEVMYTSPQDIADKIAELNRQRLEEDIEMYRSVIPEKEVNPLQMLGTPLIEGGAALLSGEGYGAAARAFNEPLEAAKLSDEEREAAIASGAAEFALGNYATERALEDATIAELIKTGDLATAEQVQKYTLANKLAGGFVQTLPESPKEPGILDVDNLSPATVYQNPKSLKRDEETPIGGLFVAVNKSGTEMKGFDSIEEATAYAQSG